MAPRSLDTHGPRDAVAADRSTPTPAVSVVATVFNEAGSIDRLAATLAAQSRRPDEVVIVDGGSTDGTWERLLAIAAEARIPLVALSRPGANIAAGRNAAIAAARGPVIAVTDAGVGLVESWLEDIAAPFAGGGRVVAGFFASDPRGAFETALGATTLPERGDIDPAAFLPSSRSVAFLKSAWEAAGGYPEWLDYCEDLVFDFRILHGHGGAAFAPDAIACFRPRPNLRAFVKQYYLYARGDGKAGLWAVRHAIRYTTYLVAIPALVSRAISVPSIAPLAWLALAAGLAAMVRTPYRRLVRQWHGLSRGEKAASIAWVPVVRIAGDLAKMIGYPVGVLWRLRHRPPDWRPSPEVGRR